MSFSRGTTASDAYTLLPIHERRCKYIHFLAAQMYNASKFKDINTDNYHFYRSTLTGNYLKNSWHNNEMLVCQFSVNRFTTCRYHNSNAASSFGTTLQNSILKAANRVCITQVMFPLTNKMQKTKTGWGNHKWLCSIFPNSESRASMCSWWLLYWQLQGALWLTMPALLCPE